MQKMQKIAVGMLGIELVGGAAMEASEIAYVEDIGLNGSGRAIAQLQIFDKPLPQRSHESYLAKRREPPVRGNQLRQVWTTKGQGANRYNRYNRTWEKEGGVRCLGGRDSFWKARPKGQDINEGCCGKEATGIKVLIVYELTRTTTEGFVQR